MAQFPLSLNALLCTDEPPLYNDYPAPAQPPQLITNQDPFWEEDELIALFSKQQGKNQLHNDLKKNPFLDQCRREAIDWILSVIEYYRFSQTTAVLAVNYLDRFLFTVVLKREKPWMSQLVAVACLSLAAKVEESHIPLLLDLQVEETSYLFEAKTIQRMEILVLSTLEWKMNPVTPISFIDHFVRRFGFNNHFCCEFLTRCQCLVVSLISDSRFMRFLPSVLATSTMLHIMSTLNPCFETEHRNYLFNTIKINKDELDDCMKMVLELKSGFFRFKSNKRKLRPITPESPKGVIDVCFASDCSSDTWVAASPSVEVVAVSPEKKIRLLCDEDGASL